MTRDLCARLGRNPHAGKVQLDMIHDLGERHVLSLSLRVFQNHAEYDWGSAFVFCCCFIQLSLPLND